MRRESEATVGIGAITMGTANGNGMQEELNCWTEQTLKANLITMMILSSWALRRHSGLEAVLDDEDSGHR